MKTYYSKNTIIDIKENAKNFTPPKDSMINMVSYYGAPTMKDRINGENDRNEQTIITKNEELERAQNILRNKLELYQNDDTIPEDEKKRLIEQAYQEYADTFDKIMHEDNYKVSDNSSGTQNQQSSNQSQDSAANNTETNTRHISPEQLEKESQEAIEREVNHQRWLYQQQQGNNYPHYRPSKYYVDYNDSGRTKSITKEENPEQGPNIENID